MKTYIINLPKDKERKTFQEQQFKNLGLSYEFFPAVTLDDIHGETYETHKNDWQRPLRKVEVACFYSHYNLWKKIVRSNEPALILEDDAWLSDALPCALKALSQLKSIDCINLESVGRKKILSKKSITLDKCNTTLHRLYLDRNGTGGYVLYPEGAKKLLAFTQKGIALADAHIRSCPNFIAYQASPILVIQLDQCQNVGLTPPLEVISNITHQSKPDLPWRQMLRFKKRRVFEQIHQGIKHLKILADAQKKEIPINKKEFKR